MKHKIKKFYTENKDEILFATGVVAVTVITIVSVKTILKNSVTISDVKLDANGKRYYTVTEN